MEFCDLTQWRHTQIRPGHAARMKSQMLLVVVHSLLKSNLSVSDEMMNLISIRVPKRSGGGCVNHSKSYFPRVVTTNLFGLQCHLQQHPAVGSRSGCCLRSCPDRHEQGEVLGSASSQTSKSDLKWLLSALACGSCGFFTPSSVRASRR